MSAQKPKLNRDRPSGPCIVVSEWITATQEVVCPCGSASVHAAYVCVKQWGRLLLRPSHNRANGSYYPHCGCPTSVCMCITAGCLSPRNLPHVGDKEPHQDTARSSDHLEWYGSLPSSCFRARDQNNLAIPFIWLISGSFNSRTKL